MQPVYRQGYFAEPDLKRQFIDSLIDIHGLDLSLWDRQGFWDFNYFPFSYFSGNQAISNVCVYSMDLIVNGVRARAAQICSVGTRPEFRRRGLGQDLLKRAIAWSQDRHDFCYLFADENAYALYQRAGFRFVPEYMPEILMQRRPPIPGAVQLDMSRQSDVDLVFCLARSRAAVSNSLGVLTPNLLMYRCLYLLRDAVTYLPPLDLLLLYRRKGNRVTVYDIVGSRVPAFAEIYPFISASGSEHISFFFMPDKLGLEITAYTPVEGNGAHVLGAFPLEAHRIIFPYTAQA